MAVEHVRCNGCGKRLPVHEMEEVEDELYCEGCAKQAWFEAERGQGWFGGEVR